MKRLKIIITLMVLTVGFVFAGDDLDSQARAAVNKAVKDKVIEAKDMSKYIEKINSHRSAEVLKELSAGAQPADSKKTEAGETGWTKGKVVGWRMDGTGNFPKVTPPTVWSKSLEGAKKNIAWETKLPCYSWSTPVIVGEKLFTLSDPYDIICLNKKDGKLLWMQSFPPFVAVTAEEKKTKPEWKEVESLVNDLQQINKQFVSTGWSKEIYKKKYDIQKAINEKTTKIDAKYALPKDMYVESWSGYTGATPCSDGENIFIHAGDGVTARYDLNGNRKWAVYESYAPIWGEHGDASSPTVVGDLLLIPSNAFKKETGEKVWTSGKYANCYGIIPFKAGGEDYVISNGIFRVRDGKMYSDIKMVPSPTPLIIDNIAYFMGASCKIESQAGGDIKLTNITPINKDGYQRLYYPAEDEKKKWEPSNISVASPVLHEGLMYSVTCQGWFTVADVKANNIVYQKHLPLDFKNGFARKTYGMGLCASISLAGKYLYILDSSGCTLILEPGREYKQIAKNNIDYTVSDGWEPRHWTGPHFEQTEATPIFEDSRIYLRGEQFMYCVGEK